MKLRRPKKLVFAFVLLSLWGCGKGEEGSTAPKEAPAAKAPQAVEEGGVISGKVLFKGSWTPRPLAVNKDQEVCGKSKPDLSLLLSPKGEVQNAVVYISEVKGGKPAEPQTVTLDQRGCEYHPHVLAFPAGSTVEILNPDGILHNIHSYSQKNSPINIAQPKFKKSLTVKFDQPEVIQIKCDVHGWMEGWFFVAGNPYFKVTDKSGRFELGEVPPGEYQLEIWHEKLGRQAKKIKVGPKQRVEVNFEFSALAG